MKIIRNELMLTEDEYDALYDSSIVVREILYCLNEDEELVADGDPLFSYDDTRNALYLLNTILNCIITIKGKEV